jgi:hypothetical protein
MGVLGMRDDLSRRATQIRLRRNMPVATLIAAACWLTMGCGRYALSPPAPPWELDSAALNHANPGERFYVIVFGAQSLPRLPAFTHSWATAVRVVECPSKCPVLEAHTISWLPASLDIHPLRLTVEPGVNLGLHSAAPFSRPCTAAAANFSSQWCEPVAWNMASAPVQ